jgi:hypothetical protein
MDAPAWYAFPRDEHFRWKYIPRLGIAGASRLDGSDRASFGQVIVGASRHAISSDAACLGFPRAVKRAQREQALAGLIHRRYASERRM